MNFKERFLELERQFAKENQREPKENVEDLLVTFFFNYQFFEPCKYISEDDEWVTFLLVSTNEVIESQIMSLKKEHIISFGVLDEGNVIEISNLLKDIEPESLYQ